MRCDARLADAQHEAAHVVVGVALGLRLHRATIVRAGDELGSCTFLTGAREAELLMLAAGPAWERRVGALEHAAGDYAVLRRMRVRGNARLRALELAAWAVLEARAAAHARVTRALLAGDVTARHVAALARGERAAP